MLTVKNKNDYKIKMIKNNKVYTGYKNSQTITVNNNIPFTTIDKIKGFNDFKNKVNYNISINSLYNKLYDLFDNKNILLDPDNFIVKIENKADELNVSYKIFNILSDGFKLYHDKDRELNINRVYIYNSDILITLNIKDFNVKIDF